MPADVLLVVAHPDDDTIFAGTLALLRHSGIAVQVVYLTSGEDGIDRTGQYQPGEALARARRVELLRALSVLGVDRPPVVLEFPDGKVKDVPIQSIEQQILAILQVTHPSTVFAFGEDGYTGHPDHQAAGEATENALKEWNKGHPDKRIQLYQRAILPSTFQAIKKEAIEFGNQTVLPDHIHPGAIKHDAVVQPISTALQQKIDAVSAYPTQFSPEMVQDFARFFKRVPTEDYYVLTP
jgi:LmbE family N-acetylglucosaminyl deacetylase